MKRILLLLLAGVAALLVGLGFVLPAVALWRHDGALGAGDAALLLLGAAVMAAGGLLAGRALRPARS